MKQIILSRLAVASVLLLSAPASVFGAVSSRDAEIAKDLKAFKANPAAAMQKIPVKRTADGKIAKPHSVFSKADILTRKFIEKKANWRSTKAGPSAQFAAPGIKDRPERLLDDPNKMLVNLEQMEAYKSGAVANQPWSTDYWGFYKGVLASRYADPNFPASSDWKQNFDYTQVPENSAQAIFAKGDLEQINQLSPAEKYDLLIGQNAIPMTEKMWSVGRRYYQSSGHVETWMGICDGWTSASYMVPRPRSSVQALASDGKTMITFYPHDLKALAAVLWAWGDYRVKGYVGARCNNKSPRMDNNGRILDEDCFNTNPGSWHEVIVNQLGVNKASMAMDATWDSEVWNQPLHSYTYSYFNPQTMDQSGTLAEAAIDVANFTDDKFKQYRSPEAVKVVGIAMDVVYLAESSPYPTDVDTEEDDYTMRVRYYYDLELDANNNIVGGEWYQNAHPDFLWRPFTGSHAVSHYESWVVGDYDPAAVVPVQWRSAAFTSSAQQGVPLAKIVDGLIAKANANPVVVPPVENEPDENTPNEPPNVVAPSPTPAPNNHPSNNAQPSPTPAPNNRPANNVQPSPAPTPNNRPTNNVQPSPAPTPNNRPANNVQPSPTPVPNNRPANNAQPTPAPTPNNRPANNAQPSPSPAPTPAPTPNRPANNAQPSPTPVPNQPANATPTPAPNRVNNAQPTPAPNRPANQPPANATPAPNRPANQPANATPTPVPNQPVNGTQPAPTPAPTPTSNQPSNQPANGTQPSPTPAPNTGTQPSRA